MNGGKTRNTGKILVTAGPTVEPIDPVRFLSNYSTGTMGYEIAAAGAREGFSVCLVSGPVNLAPPPGVEVVKVATAAEMKEKVFERLDGCACLIMAAAVCDFRPEKTEERKIKKRESLTISLVKNPDILGEIGKREGMLKVGFALETDNPLENALGKLKAKALDLIILNTRRPGEEAFGDVEARYTMIGPDGDTTETDKIGKRRMAEMIISKVKEMSA